MLRAPSVFVSSTCYELRHVRDGLETFLKDHVGYEPLLSERPSFPVDLDKDTVENCQKQVRASDLFVLIIGHEFGSEARGSTKSVVNVEYETAREEGIPAVVFIEARTINAYEASCRNPDADLSGEVGDARLFDFIEKIRDREGKWVFRFDRVSDIVTILRTQLAYRAQEAFVLLRRHRRGDVVERSLKGMEHLGEFRELLSELPSQASEHTPGHTIMDLEIRAGEYLASALEFGFLGHPQHADLQQVARISLGRGFVYQLQQQAAERRGESRTIIPPVSWHAFANVGSELSKKRGWSYEDVTSYGFFSRTCDALATMLNEYTAEVGSEPRAEAE